jgi:hypothetical protein
MKGRIKPQGPLGVVLFGLAVIMLRQGQEPFTTYFYAFAWWSYILAADALVFWIRGNSLIVNKTRTFVLMIPLSIFCWCIFEAFNFRLSNWHYITLPRESWQRWIGYAVAYGTVLPGLCETYHFLKEFRFFQSIPRKRWRPSPQSPGLMISLGGIFLLVPLVFPRYCFPLVWIGFALLFEPILYLMGRDSLQQDIMHGKLARLLALLAAGLICGFLWELWNFWAQTKWIYTVPFFEEAKLFEMPLPGFLGFPPFAVSAYALYRALLMVMQRQKLWQHAVFWFSLSLLCLLVFVGIDRYTVVSFIPLVRDMPGVEEAWKGKLQDAGIEKVQDLIRKGVPGLVQLGISHREAVELVRKAAMITFKGIGIENYRLLLEAGVGNLAELAQQDPQRLYRTMQKKTRQGPIPRRALSPALVRLWVREARKEVN